MKQRNPTKPATITNPQTITPQEWNRVAKSAITLYIQSIWNLSHIIELGTNKFGRDTIVSMTPFDESKVNYFNIISRVEGNKKNLLPELVYEIASSKDKKKWLEIANQQGIKPNQLRKMIRQSESIFHKSKQLMKVKSYPRLLILLENEMKQMTDEQKLLVTQQLQSITEKYRRV